MNINIQSILKDNFKQIGDMLLHMLPRKKQEIFLFSICFLLYISYSLILIFKSAIIDSPWAVVDYYLSFDNVVIFHLGRENPIGHPLMYELSRPLIHFGYFLLDNFGYKSKTVASVMFCTTLISLSVVYIFKYLRDILSLDKAALYIFSCFFALFSTNLVLCFTSEMFTLSTFFISFTIYYYSKCINEEKNVTFAPNAFLALVMGGITITNFAKGIFPMLFTKEKVSRKILKILIIGIVFAFIIFRLFHLYDNVSSEVLGRMDKFNISQIQRPFYENAIDLFFGATIFFPEIIWDTVNYKGMINVGVYHHWWQYLFVSIIYISVILAIIKNCKNKLIWMLCLFFFYDIFIHIIVGYGLSEGFLYGGHWVCLIPLFLGWFYKSSSNKNRKYLLIIFTLLLVGLAVNNIIRLDEFIEIAIRKFPSSIPEAL